MAQFKQRKSGRWQALIRWRGYAQQSAAYRFRADAEAWTNCTDSAPALQRLLRVPAPGILESEENMPLPQLLASLAMHFDA